MNTVGSVAGSLAAGFLAIPWLGLQHTLTLVAGTLVAACIVASVWGRVTSGGRVVSLATAAAVAGLVFLNPAWDRQLLASGAYMYAPFVPRDLDLVTQLKAGSLLYYREGAAATISVKRLTGTLSLAIDGKTDASNRSDMLTQRVIAHLPLLLHENPKTVFIIGMGSGVTLGSALRHPVERVDVAEISSEVIEASRHFSAENHDALSDPRARIIVGDGRSHLQLTAAKYDVIVSEPSNPWIAGVAALFTREFFEAARAHLAPGGVICQWANIYNISDRDLRSIAATFTSVFPHGTVWLVERTTRCSWRRTSRSNAGWISSRAAGRARTSPPTSPASARSSRSRCCRSSPAVPASWPAMEKAPASWTTIGCGSSSRRRARFTEARRAKMPRRSAACSPTRTVQARSEPRSSKRRPPSGATAAR